MHKPIFFLLFINFTLGALPYASPRTCARAQSHQDLALQAYLSGDLAGLNQAIAAAAAAAITDPAERLLTQSEYYLAGVHIAMGREDENARDDYMDKMSDALDDLWEIDERNGHGHALFSALLGMRIARSPITAPVNGSRASSYAQRALKFGKNHRRVLHHAAGNLFYTPEMWGGDPGRAMQYLERAIGQYGADRDRDWRYLSSLAMLGQVQAKLGMKDAARATYQTALTAQPDFYYVSKVLLPHLNQSGK